MISSRRIAAEAVARSINAQFQRRFMAFPPALL
jgi:hypothetical protein